METYVTVSFYMGLFSVGVYAFRIATASYPRIETVELGKDVVNILLLIGFLMWAGSLLFMKGN